jgi:hypothetical protein
MARMRFKKKAAIKRRWKHETGNIRGIWRMAKTVQTEREHTEGIS